MKLKKGRLLFRWSNKENDFVCNYPSGRGDSNLLMGRFTCESYASRNPLDELAPSLIEELEKRGYDTKTLWFQVDKKVVSEN